MSGLARVRSLSRESREEQYLMEKISTEQIAFVIVMAVLLMFVLPVVQSRTGKSLSELLFGVGRKKKQDGADGAPKKSAGREPRMNNGTRNDLTVFVSHLLKTANKNGMGVVAPGLVEYKGKTAQLVAFLVAPSGVTGIYCLGFGGVVMPGEKDGPWKQHMNGQDTTFRNPLAVCKEQYELVRAAMDEAGVKADLDIVTVFTNSRVTLKAVPSARIYTQKQFMEHLKNTDSLKWGDVDVKEMTKVLARLAKIKEKKAGRNKKQREQEG